MLERKGFKVLGTCALALSLSLGVASVQAASACKGLGSSACQKDTNCSWVKDYVRKDGVKVAGHCKSKPKSSGKSKTEKKSESKKKSSDKKKSDSKS